MTPREAIRVLEIGDFADFEDRKQALVLLAHLAQQAETARPWVRCVEQKTTEPQPVWCVRNHEVHEAMALGNGAFITRDGQYWRDATHWKPRRVDPKPELPDELIGP